MVGKIFSCRGPFQFYNILQSRTKLLSTYITLTSLMRRLELLLFDDVSDVCSLPLVVSMHAEKVYTFQFSQLLPLAACLQLRLVSSPLSTRMSPGHWLVFYFYFRKKKKCSHFIFLSNCFCIYESFQIAEVPHT